MDNYASVRSVPLLTVFGWLGIDTSKFKKRQGKQEFYGICPFHSTKNNQTSFSFTSDLAHCFSCETKFRGAIDAVKLFQKVGFKQAVAFLEERVGSVPAQAPAEAAVEAPIATGEALKPYAGSYEKYKVPCEWLEQRIPDAAIRERYGVFCYNNPARKSAYSGRVMLPVKDVEGHLFGYLGRNIDTTTPGQAREDIPKYLFPPKLPKSRFLFGADVLKSQHQLPVKVLYVGESPWMVMRFAMMGYPAVAAYGWSVSDDQIDILAQLAKGVYYLPDRNKAQDCAGVVHRLAQRLWVKAPPLSDGVDDAEYLTETQVKAL